jgi:uncharacterized phage-like protein YoqJ
MVENPQELVNATVNVVKYRGEVKNRRAKVVTVRDTHTQPLQYSSYKRYRMERSRYLITVYDLDRGVFRSYYHAYAEMQVEKQSWIRRLFNW